MEKVIRLRRGNSGLGPVRRLQEVQLETGHSRRTVVAEVKNRAYFLAFVLCEVSIANQELHL